MFVVSPAFRFAKIVTAVRSYKYTDSEESPAVGMGDSSRCVTVTHCDFDKRTLLPNKLLPMRSIQDWETQGQG